MKDLDSFGGVDVLGDECDIIGVGHYEFGFGGVVTDSVVDKYGPKEGRQDAPLRAANFDFVNVCCLKIENGFPAFKEGLNYFGQVDGTVTICKGLNNGRGPG